VNDPDPKVTFLEVTGTRTMTFALGPVGRAICRNQEHGGVRSPAGTLAPWPLDIIADDGGAL
jgi:hypothetical protein